jgi:hypothetical protein
VPIFQTNHKSLIERYSHIKKTIDECYSPNIDEFILHLNKINSIDFIKSKMEIVRLTDNEKYWSRSSVYIQTTELNESKDSKHLSNSENDIIEINSNTFIFYFIKIYFFYLKKNLPSQNFLN